MKTVFAVNGVYQSYGASSDFVLKNIQLKIEEGSFTILLGQNGSGKSSLMKCLAGLQSWTKGEILLNGEDRSFDREDFNRGMLFVSEDIVLPNYSLDLLSEIYAEVWGSFDRGLFERVLSYGRIKSSRASAGLSRGQKALVQLALALGVGIKTLLIDEITAVLDPYVRARVVDELVRYNQSNGATILVATNIASEFAGVEAQAILIESGAIYLSGSIAELSREFVVVDVPVEREAEFADFVVLSNRMVSRSRMIGRRRAGVAEFELQNSATLEEMFIFLSARKAA